jgi:hypothetical protein
LLPKRGYGLTTLEVNPWSNELSSPSVHGTYSLSPAIGRACE